MVKFYSKNCEYAFRILTKIPRDKMVEKFSAVSICRQANVPIHSARKVLQLLVDQGYLDAVSGPGGGYVIKKDPRKITLLEIVKVVDGKDHFDNCILGFPQCNSKQPCSMHHSWLKIKKEIIDEMEGQSLFQMMSENREHKK